MTHQCERNLPIFKPRAGKDTKSSIFLFRAASNRFKCKHKTLGSLENVCCFFVGVFLLQVGQSTPSPSISGRIKCSRHVSTLISLHEASFSACNLSTSSDKVSEMFINSSLWTRLPPHSSHTNTERKTPSKVCLTISVGQKKY